MEKSYRMDYTVASFDLSPSLKLKYSMILRLTQETGNRHLYTDGLTYEIMRDKGVVFLLTEVSAVFHRMPAGGEKIGITTWFAGLRGARFIRRFRFEDASGAPLAECESLLVAADPDTHRIIRPSAYPFKDTVNIGSGEVNLPDFHTSAPVSARQTFRREVRYSDIDFNGHMNNAVYADLVCDYLPGGMEGRELAALNIAFRGEARQGDAIDICVEQRGDVVQYQGGIDGRRCFEALARVKGEI